MHIQALFSPPSLPSAQTPAAPVQAAPAAQPQAVAVPEPHTTDVLLAAPASGRASQQLAFLDAPPAAEARKGRYQNLLQELKGQSEAVQVNTVNRFFNQEIAYLSDAENQGQTDYWQTPRETLHLGRGDCEDYAIAKFEALKSLGIPEERLHIVYVRAEGYGAHMVMSYQDPQGHHQILDNLSSLVLPADRRNDLTPVFAFNRQGIWQTQPGKQWLGRQLKDTTQQLSKYQNLLQRMQQGH